MPQYKFCGQRIKNTLNTSGEFIRIE